MPAADRTAIFALTGGLPRELARLCVNCWQGATRFDAVMEERYLYNAEPDYSVLIRKLFRKPVSLKPDAPETLLERSFVFAHQLYAERDTTTAPDEWQNSGLVVKDADRGHVMSCKVAHLAFLKVFEQVVPDALDLFVRVWYALLRVTDDLFRPPFPILAGRRSKYFWSIARGMFERLATSVCNSGT